MEQNNINNVIITGLSSIMAKQDIIVTLLQNVASAGDPDILKSLVEESKSLYAELLQDYGKQLDGYLDKK